MAEGTVENWTLTKTIHTEKGSGYHLVGLVSKQKVALKEESIKHIFVTNLADETTTRVISRSIQGGYIFRCVPLARNEAEDLRVVCGMSNTRIVIIENFRPFEEKIIHEIPLKQQRHDKRDNNILVTVDLNGALLAAAYGTSTIYVINPADWSIAEKPSDIGDLEIREMHAMGNGCIAVMNKCPENKDVCILDSSGNNTQTINLHDKDVRGIAINKVNDSILVLYRDRKLDDFAVDVLSSSGQLSAQRILSFRKKGVICPTFLWLDSNQIVIHEDAEGDIYVYSPPGLNVL